MLNTLQQQNFTNLFQVFDKNKNGNLSETDFMQAFATLKARANNEEKAILIEKTARRWFTSIYVFSDKDRDRQISLTEWLGWATKMVKAGANDRGYSHFQDALFAGMSGNDASITSEDYQQWFSAFGLSGDAATIFATMDSNGNGELSKEGFAIRLSEFIEADTAEAGNALFGTFRT